MSVTTSSKSRVATTDEEVVPSADRTVAERKRVVRRERPRPSFLRRNGGLVALLALVAATYAMYRFYQYRQPYEWSGTVEARAVPLGSDAGGRVKAVLVEEGQDVTAGTVLIVLEGRHLEAKRAEARAEHAAAAAAFQRLTKGARQDEILQASARVSEARAAQAKFAVRASQEGRDLEAANTLFKSGAVSSAERDTKADSARAASEAAAEASARVKEAEASLRLATNGARSEDLQIESAKVAVAEARLAAIETEIEELSIRAPCDARVETVAVRSGAQLKPKVPVIKLLEKGQLYVRLFVPETQLGHVHVGQELPITVDSFPGRTFKGRVAHINGAGEFTPLRLTTTDDRASEVFGTRVDLLDGEHDLRAGMAAFVHVAKR